MLMQVKNTPAGQIAGANCGKADDDRQNVVISTERDSK